MAICTHMQNSWQIIKAGLPLPRQMYHAVIAIRQSKTTRPKSFGQLWLFFQNPIISTEHYQKLCVDYPNLPCYLVTKTLVKVPAGWLIDQAGLKGQGVPPILTHAKQALVLTNHMPFIATQEDIKATADVIIAAVKQKFNITLVREPAWINADGSYN